ncbi:uncharacterized protein B0P05DRAFT_529642 [Gilbertella persicaria]|uniref:Ribonucleases P/MRP subunit Pop8-like domain-containing protein n=1 Tax=Rhizopus stolonifer TaxID=4846 RepID=A0A367KS96_RHIST|nr:uncharacterized protein B0P05DRAFT_529642 [Gilbertella persicaria]KAI8090177.1 hypothetical protein B0P05DRAFT_529642 [Gilbertella persicaria]RCI05061.1 hypothetical protein CU098_013410 [Rhizopus stolonifer]
MSAKPWLKHFKPIQDWQYLKVKIWSDEDLDVQVTELSFRMSIQQALQTIFGQVGASCYINVLDWNKFTNQGIIKIKQSELTTVWSALLNHQFLIANKLCTLDIIDSSAHLISLVQSQ